MKATKIKTINTNLFFLIVILSIAPNILVLGDVANECELNSFGEDRVYS